jgi:hypothetical protein
MGCASVPEWRWIVESTLRRVESWQDVCDTGRLEPRERRKRYSENSSATIRLISSGIVRSKLRRPDSTRTRGFQAWPQPSTAASVEFHPGND